MRTFFFLCIFGTFSVLSARQLSIHDDFESLLGKYTEGWKYADPKKDREQLDLYMSAYRKYRHLQFTPSNEVKIPKILHFIWLGPKNFPIGSVKNIRSWIVMHPDWEVYFWTDRKRQPPLRGMKVCYVEDFSFAKLKTLFDESDNWGEKSDLLRLEVLFQMGGLYADHDMVCIKSYDNLHSAYDFFACVGTPHPRVSGYSITASNGNFGSKPYHPIVEKSMDLILQRKEEIHWLFPTKSPHDTEQRIINSTYISLTMAIQDQLCKGENIDIVFPACYFLALGELPNFYARHQYQGLWRVPTHGESDLEVCAKHKMTRVEKSQRRLLVMELTLFMLIFFSFVLVLMKKRRVY